MLHRMSLGCLQNATTTLDTQIKDIRNETSEQKYRYPGNHMSEKVGVKMVVSGFLGNGNPR